MLAIRFGSKRQGQFLFSAITNNCDYISSINKLNLSKNFSTTGTSSGKPSYKAFDRDIKTIQRDRAARKQKLWREANAAGGGEIIDYDYFRREIAMRLVDRLDDVKRDDGFPLALDIGSGPGFIHKAICADDAIDGVGGIGGVRKLVQLDSSNEMLHRDENVPVEGGERCEGYRLHGDEEAKLPFPDGTFDLVISSSSLHWVNDIPGLFSEVHRVLKPDGCFMFAMIGGTTLPELRISMLLAELEREGGVSPHVGPFVELSDVGSLLQRTKFALPTIDTDTIRISFPYAFVLMEHLQRMGENNACINRRKDGVSLDTLLASACIYDQMFQIKDEESGISNEIEASIQVIYAIGWTPHASQQKPDERGTATHKVGEIVLDNNKDESK